MKVTEDGKSPIGIGMLRIRSSIYILKPGIRNSRYQQPTMVNRHHYSGLRRCVN